MAITLESLLDLLYPPRCRCCRNTISGSDEMCFCWECRQRIREVSHPLCTACGYPFLDTRGEDHLCGACLARPPSFVQARAWACYPRGDERKDPLRFVMQQFKYGRKVSLGRPLGRLLSKGCNGFFQESTLDGIIPVPLHPKRLRWRGFNQAVILAQQVSRLWRLPMDPFILLRLTETEPQTQLSEEDRRKNMRGAFSLNPKKSVQGKRILLVDDIYTSGATVNECSCTLIRGGAKEVSILTLARTIW